MDQMNNNINNYDDSSKWMQAFDLASNSSTRMSIYADKAEEEGFNAIGDTLDDMARSNTAIARVMLERAGELGSIEENLQSGIDNNQLMLEYYNNMRETDDDMTMTAISQVLEGQIGTLQDTLDSLDAETIYMPGRQGDWICSRCGFIARGRNCPLNCPLCSCHQGYFRPIRPIRLPIPILPPRRPGQRPPFNGRR